MVEECPLTMECELKRIVELEAQISSSERSWRCTRTSAPTGRSLTRSYSTL